MGESAADVDLGSGAPMLLPDLQDAGGVVRHLAVGAGKDGHLYVVNRDDLGKFSAAGNNIWQDLAGALRSRWLHTMAIAHSGPLDLVINVFFYMPLGFTWFLRRRSGANRVARILGCILAGAALSFCLEILQFAVPTRDSSLTDVTMNTLGSLLGAVVAILTERIQFNSASLGWLRPGPLDPVIALLLGGWVVLKTAPMMPRLGLYKAWMAIEPLRTLRWSLAAFAQDFALYLLMLSALRALVKREYFWRAALKGCAATLTAQVVFAGHHLKPDEIAAGIAALTVVALLRPLHTGVTLKPVFILTLLIFMVAELAPFNFSTTAQPFLWVPFTGTLESNREQGFYVALGKILLYAGALWAGSRSGLSLRVTTLILAVVVAAGEGMQVYLPTRVPEITDVLMVLLLGGLMAIPALRAPVVRLSKG